MENPKVLPPQTPNTPSPECPKQPPDPKRKSLWCESITMSHHDTSVSCNAGMVSMSLVLRRAAWVGLITERMQSKQGLHNILSAPK
eukprot:4617594-Amphidinium_carterae.1